MSVDITVVIATRDRPAGLARCLAGVLAGTAQPSEIVVVDQGTGEEARRAIAAANSAVPIVYVQQVARGLSASRNAAITAARCPIIAVLDDDCVPDRAWIATVATVFALPDPPAAVTGRVLPLGPERPGYYAISTRASQVRREYRARAAPWEVGTGGNFAVNCAWLARIGPYDERLGAGTSGRAGEDMDLLYRLIRVGARVRYEPDALIYHERQDHTRRRASRIGYGWGIGTFCGLWLRRRDPYMLVLLMRWAGAHLWALAGAARRGQWDRLRDEVLMLGGAVRGLFGGLALGSRPLAVGER